MKPDALVIEIAERGLRHEELLSRLRAGEEIVFADQGTPVGTVNPTVRRSTRKFNGFKGEVWITDDFDDPLPQALLSEFHK